MFSIYYYTIDQVLDHRCFDDLSKKIDPRTVLARKTISTGAIYVTGVRDADVTVRDS